MQRWGGGSPPRTFRNSRRNQGATWNVCAGKARGEATQRPEPGPSGALLQNHTEQVCIFVKSPLGGHPVRTGRGREGGGAQLGDCVSGQGRDDNDDASSGSRGAQRRDSHCKPARRTHSTPNSAEDGDQHQTQPTLVAVTGS